MPTAISGTYSTSRRTERKIGQVLNITIPAVASIAAGVVVTYTVPCSRAGVNDIVVINAQVQRDGIAYDAGVTSTGTVTIRQYNFTGSTISTILTTQAQLQVLKR